MRLSLVTGPDGEPVGLTEAIDHLRLEPDTEEDQLLNGHIAAARGHAEAFTGRQFLTATWKATFDCFPGYNAPLQLPLPPLVSVTTIKYLDTGGVQQTLAQSEYVVNAPAGPRAIEGQVYPAFLKYWPFTAWRQDAIEVTFVAGYGDQSRVPQEIKQAMLLAIGHFYENREAVVVGETAVTVPLAVEALLTPFARLSGVLR